MLDYDHHQKCDLMLVAGLGEVHLWVLQHHE